MIYLAGDKHGFKAIGFAEKYLNAQNIPFENLGVKKEEDDMLLEIMIPNVVKKVKENKDNRAIISCGTGVGVEVGANKFSGIRACLATNAKVAKYSIVYDKCNVLCLVGWDSTQENIEKILEAWFHSEYDGDKNRLNMIEVFDTWH